MREATQQLTRRHPDLRALIAELRPPALDQLGLAPALDARSRSGPPPATALEIDADVELPATARLGAEIETTVYRVVQESLTNVVKHARAASVQLDGALRRRRGGGRVADDGLGFDPEDAPARASAWRACASASSSPAASSSVASGSRAPGPWSARGSR